ncbi:hypothetical protein DL764_001225 [Monosporascus ibericus]|uniref:Heterokaryon incompatibility domain-containing protein n=1 Tax=Monosporascus ibericus TaxID=155417 RepID=A0A4Q4TV74_9PEZI|nr:hypothetical protein DL764_001225 [Monosporascus ibericus]
MQRLPQTIQDAIQVSHFLGLQFIWVDALCIIQDSLEDWKAEARRMADVYENSLITIAASGASSCHEGLFSARDALMETPCRLFRISPELSMFAMLEENEFPGSIQMKVGQEALYKRGWVMQERIFARRTLHFGQGVHWECRCGDCSETGGWQYNDPPIAYLRPKEIFNVRFAPLGKASNQNDLEDGGSAIDFLRAWDKLIMRPYTSSALTKKEDRLVAISGIIQRMTTQMGWRNLFGLWEPRFVDQLLWHLSPAAQPPITVTRTGLSLILINISAAATIAKSMF